MKITNCGRGVHAREVVGIAKLQALPSQWYAYTNLDLAVSIGKSREIDVIMITDDRIFLIDLKDWGGHIESKGGRWIHNARDGGPSPVGKIHQNVKDVMLLLKSHIQKYARGQGLSVPRIHGLIVITAKADIRGIATTEAASVLSIEDFLKAVATAKARLNTFGPVFPTFIEKPLTSQDWKHHLSRFFNVQGSVFVPGRRNYGGFVATSDTTVFEHRDAIYTEYDAVDANSAQTFGTLRVWDFSKADARFQSEEGRAEIVGRERSVIAYLRDRSEECELAILQPMAEDPDRGVSYWEVYDRRRRMKRLVDFATTEAVELPRAIKVELARQILSRVNALHLVDASHLDLGPHSIWLQQPSAVKLSHLMAASYPQVQSLGEKRYQFLSSARVPEDVLGGGADPKRKDVFLLGVAIHHLLFNGAPNSESDEMPPEWSATVDQFGEYEDLHAWFEAALALDPSKRFAGAGTALDEFNKAIEKRPSAKEITQGLEQFHTAVGSQMQLFGLLPPTKTLRDDTFRSIWQSDLDGRPVFVKMWKRTCWGDQIREGPRLLDFLTHARNLQQSPPLGCPTILEVMWLGDAIVLVQEWVEAPNLAVAVDVEPSVWTQGSTVLRFLKTLTERVTALHDSGFAHGDLKPQNVLVLSDSHDPVLVDVIDFSPVDDGEIRSTAYAPPQGGRYERDRYAVTKIAEDLLSASNLDPKSSENLRTAIAECRTNTPPNGTLLPLLEALERALHPIAAKERPVVRLSIRQAEIGLLLADEGLFYLRRGPGQKSLFIRGACEEIQLEINDFGQPFRGRRRTVDQRSISIASKYEFMSIPLDIEVIESDINDFSDLRVLIEDPKFLAAWDRSSPSTEPDSVLLDNSVANAPLENVAEDALTEAVAAERQTTDYPDVAELWRRLIEAESELTTEGLATSESSYRKGINRHVVPFELDSGAFDFNKNDRVLVERLDQYGHWRRIGHLDISLSRPDFVVIDITRFLPPTSARVVLEDQRLRFTSHYEVTSLQRRNNAVTRILSRRSRIQNLIDIFDPDSGQRPFSSRLDVDPESLKATYGLNDVQANSLSSIVDLRPVGLLQGPPGTGKTVFIAALVHYTLTNGIVRNVLLASQSHEAVNNAAEAVLKLFARHKEQPSILRVGHESVVSERLLPFHTERVEQGYKDRFRACIKDRLYIGGRSLGINETLISDIVFIETAIRPVAEKVAELEGVDQPDKAKIQSLRATIQGQLNAIGLQDTTVDEVSGDDIVEAVIKLVGKRQKRESRVSPGKISCFRALARLARDFVGTVSTARRSFETFLAGTRQIVAGTCVGLGRSSLGLTSTPFDLVIVDEAARCTASELSVPIQAGRWVVLVGDHAQLEPQHKPELVVQVAADMNIAKREILRSDFERTFNTAYGAAVGRRLTKQYRMVPPIGRLVSSSFYNNSLEHGRADLAIDAAALPSDLDKALLWIETDSFGDRGLEQPERNGTSLTNMVEADLIMTLLKQWGEHEAFVNWLRNQTVFANPVGIICTYAAQRDLLHKKLQITNLSPWVKSSIKIDTVDSYQGKENPIVILSLVRNNVGGLREDGVATIRDGYLARPNRINVAVSRAMDRLVVIGAKRRWRSRGPMARIVEAFDKEIAGGDARTIEGVSLLELDAPRKRANPHASPSPIVTGE